MHQSGAVGVGLADRIFKQTSPVECGGIVLIFSSASLVFPDLIGRAPGRVAEDRRDVAAADAGAALRQPFGTRGRQRGCNCSCHLKALIKSERAARMQPRNEIQQRL